MHLDNFVDHLALACVTPDISTAVGPVCAPELLMPSHERGDFRGVHPFLLGKQAIFTHEPPIYLLSTTAVRIPSWAMVRAIHFPPVPLPRIDDAYLSAAFIRSP